MVVSTASPDASPDDDHHLLSSSVSMFLFVSNHNINVFNHFTTHDTPSLTSSILAQYDDDDDDDDSISAIWRLVSNQANSNINGG